jgi:hypothetical protein
VWPCSSETVGHHRIALASVANGRIIRELSVPPGEIKGLAVSPDRTTVYFAEGGAVYSLAGSGSPTRIVEGDTIALDPSGRNLYAKQFGRDPIGLVQIDTASGHGVQLVLPPNPRLTTVDLSPTAVDARQRILLDTTSPLTWFYGAAVLDTATGKMTPVPWPGFYDCVAPGWTPDGKVVCAGAALTGSMWRYRHAPSTK